MNRIYKNFIDDHMGRIGSLIFTMAMLLANVAMIICSIILDGPWTYYVLFGTFTVAYLIVAVFHIFKIRKGLEEFLEDVERAIDDDHRSNA